MTVDVELLEQLRELDETFLLELLDLKSGDLVDAFIEKINDRETYIRKELAEKN